MTTYKILKSIPLDYEDERGKLTLHSLIPRGRTYSFEYYPWEVILILDSEDERKLPLRDEHPDYPRYAPYNYIINPAATIFL